MAALVDLGAFDNPIEIVDGVGAKEQRKLKRHIASDRYVVVLNLKAALDRLEAPSCIDAVHPSSETSRQLAELIVPNLIE